MVVPMVTLQFASHFCKILKKKFERHNDMCKAFLHIESNQRQTMNYKITNDCIAIWAEYENDSHWDVLRGKIFLQRLLHQYRLHLLSYDLSNAIMSFDRFWEKKKKTVEYTFPLNLEKFDCLFEL